MNRRDTIIIAVILNAGLLATLFVMAINNDDYSVTDLQSGAPPIVDITEQSIHSSPDELTASKPAEQMASQSGDELDNALRHYSNDPQMILVDDELEPIDKGPVELPPAITTTPPQNPEPRPVLPPHYVDITVKKGDALEKIARANNTTVEAIKKANDLTSSKLNIGQLLKVPTNTKKENASSNKTQTIEKESKSASKASSSTAKETPKIAYIEPEFYVVKSGDNPWKIAKQFHVKFDELLKLNHLDEEKARNLKVGDKIRVK